MDTDDLFRAQTETVPADLSSAADSAIKAEEDLLGRDNVVGVGVGYKISGGEVTGTPSVMVLVSTKLPADLLPRGAAAPKKVSDVVTDVLEVGHLFAGGHDPALSTPPGVHMKSEALTLAKRVRPARPGYSVGHYQITAGTIGAGAYDLKPHPGMPTRYYVLSNNHVLANSGDARLGDPILQPGPYDGGTLPTDALGRLSRFVPIRFDGACNYVDAAVAEVSFDQIDRNIYWSGYPASIGRAARIGMVVKKTGRTTNFTTGTVTAIAATVNVNYGEGRVAKFCNQIVTTNMSEGGDSGSLVLNTENHPIGLLFAGSSEATIHNPIALVQQALKVRIWP